MTNNYLFPTNHPILSKNKKLLRVVKKLEGYHEIYNDFLSLQATITSIRKLTAPPIPKKTPSFIQDEFLKEMDAIKELADNYYKTRNNFQILRDTVEYLVKKMGAKELLAVAFYDFYILIEKIFSGAVILYMKSFASGSGRPQLDPKHIYNKNPELLNFHNFIASLRNKHFAHAEFLANKHFLHFKYDNNTNNLNFEQNLYSGHDLYSAVDHIKFENCVSEVIAYLSTIKKQCEQDLITILTDEEKQLICSLSREECIKYSEINDYNKFKSRV